MAKNNSGLLGYGSAATQVKGRAPQPEDPVNLNPKPSEEVMRRLKTELSTFFGAEVSLLPGGSSSRTTDLPSSDWDYYFEVPGVEVDEHQRDELLLYPSKAMNCTAKLSERGIAIQLQCGLSLLEIVPRHATYFDWDRVEFPRFLGCLNRSKNDEDLRLFLDDNPGARILIRELKAAFKEVEPKLPSFLLEHLVKRMAMTCVCHDPWRGFVTQLKLPEAFDVACHTLEEIATQSQRGRNPDPFSPLQDLWEDLETAEPRRKQLGRCHKELSVGIGVSYDNGDEVP